MTWLNYLSVATAMSTCYVIACRIAKMQLGVTRVGIFLQHALLAMAMFGSALLQFTAPELSLAVASSGVAAFLLMSADRWRAGAPGGTATGPDL